MKAYLSKVLPIRGEQKFIATIDFTNGDVWSGVTRLDEKQAEKDLKDAEKRFDVNLVPDTRSSPALTKEEREFVLECKKQNKAYKDVLLKSRIERRKLTQEEMDEVLGNKKVKILKEMK